MRGLAAALATVALVALAAASTDHAEVFGVAMSAVLGLLVTGGFGGLGADRRVLVFSAGVFAAYAALVLWMFFLDARSDQLVLWGGLPRATAVLVYGIWPVGATPGLLYAMEFSRRVLPERKLQAFRSEHAAGQDTEPHP